MVELRGEDMGRGENFYLYLLIGQSNMAGRGEVGPEDREVHPRVLTLDRANVWVPAADPIHFDKPIVGVGPGLTFGKVMAERDPAIRVGLIPCAAGGSPIVVWRPGGYWEQTDSRPYDDAVKRARVGMRDGVLKGILWHQGESDADGSGEDAPLYEGRLVALIGALRADLGLPDLPFVVGTLGDFFAAGRPAAEIVNSALRGIPRRVAHTACVDAQGLGHKGDELHFGAEAARELGRRYAEAMIRRR
jgi:hypothetical protein